MLRILPNNFKQNLVRLFFVSLSATSISCAKFSKFSVKPDDYSDLFSDPYVEDIQVFKSIYGKDKVQRQKTIPKYSIKIGQDTVLVKTLSNRWVKTKNDKNIGRYLLTIEEPEKHLLFGPKEKNTILFPQFKIDGQSFDVNHLTEQAFEFKNAIQSFLFEEDFLEKNEPQMIWNHLDGFKVVLKEQMVRLGKNPEASDVNQIFRYLRSERISGVDVTFAKGSRIIVSAEKNPQN